ncbi:NADH:flavin oxidoreductase/NADH oxidase family protein [Algirhabdus cladophorae]|uniref:NADH:flavin oxidoreductase/NADH oxidase family protein n=1 Tax=Algirhabdus cladophorae TaxID=3377108 RepID=UPI003B84AA67
MSSANPSVLAQPLKLPCGVVLKNRLAKSAMSDSLGDGCGGPTDAQIRLYERWAEGGLALSIVGEVQGTALYPEKPGNLVLNTQSNPNQFKALARAGLDHKTQLWLQLGHAGAMADPAICAPKGPSALDLPGLRCDALSLSDIQQLPAEFARTARLAQDYGFGGVEIHAAHGFLLSQFLSPLFNKRDDAYGGSLANRMRLMLDSVDAVRRAVGPDFPIAVKLNATDQLAGGFAQDEALGVMAVLDATSVDLIDISGGTYFPGAPSSSDRAGFGPYFVDFAKQSRAKTTKPLMVTGGFKTLDQAQTAITDGSADLIGLARAVIVDPDLPQKWLAGHAPTPKFPHFENPPEGGVTAWYTMQITQIADDGAMLSPAGLSDAVTAYTQRDQQRRALWTMHFAQDSRDQS